MKRKKIITIAVFAIAVLAGAWYFSRKRNTGAERLTTATVTYGNIARSITATGTVQPVDTLVVGAQVSGLVVKVYADFNSMVRKGQLLAEVDPSIMTAQLQEARSTLATAQSNLDYQQNNYTRQNQLYAAGAISKADYQLALNQYNSARAAVGNATGQVQIASKNLTYTRIYSPVDGTVLNRNVNVGQTIAASLNAPVLFVIARDLTRMRVNAAVDEADIGHVLKGQAVSFTVDAFPDNIFKGTVQEIYLHPSVSANVVTYTTLIDVDNTDMRLKPGMTASINIYEEQDSAALLIPLRALHFMPDAETGKKYTLINSGNTTKNPSGPDTTGSVWIKDGDSLIHTNIVTGLSDDTKAKVLSGLNAGDEVVTGIATGNAAHSRESDNQQSPFMPKMRPRNTPASNRAK